MATRLFPAIVSTTLVHSVITLCLTSGIAAAANADWQKNWPAWRGPLANGVAPAANPPSEWSEEKNVKWKVELPGRGSATPAIWGNRVFVLTAIATGKKVAPKPDQAGGISLPPGLAQVQPPPPGQEGQGRRGRGGRGGFGGGSPPDEEQQFAVLCLDRQTGKTLWQKSAIQTLPHEGHHRDHGFASSSPITDGERVYAYFGSRGLHCFDMDGNLQWQREFGRMRTANGFGEGCSPALHGNTIVVKWDHEGDDFIEALDKRTGKTLWNVKRDERTSWSTPLVVEHGGKAQVIATASSRILSYDLANGNVIWESDGLTPNVIPSPVTGHGLIYAMSGFRGNMLKAIRPDKTGDLSGTDAIVWKHDRSTPYVPSPLLYGDLLYFCAGNEATLSCFDAKSGKAHYEANRVEGIFGVYASPLGASGRVYLIGRNGVSVVLKQSPAFEVIATNKLDEKFDASPAAAGNELFLRGQKFLYCLAGN
ncbi:MAG: PQQ-binding-like beta-propeller repeat protein [Verrucomicrobiota bacterium]|jgi:outer membrane protein assembly factor BamB